VLDPRLEVHLTEGKVPSLLVEPGRVHLRVQLDVRQRSLARTFLEPDQHRGTDALPAC